MPNNEQARDELTAEEIQKRMEHALRRSLTMRPEHKPTKASRPGHAQEKTSTKPSESEALSLSAFFERASLPPLFSRIR
jgi:hypothetical protein